MGTGKQFLNKLSALARYLMMPVLMLAAVYILLLMLTGSISAQDIIWFKNIFSRGSKSEKRGLCAARINDRQRSLSH